MSPLFMVPEGMRNRLTVRALFNRPARICKPQPSCRILIRTMAITHTSGREIVSIQGAMALTGVSRRTIYNWIARGKIELIRLPSGTPRIFVDTLYQKAA